MGLFSLVLHTHLPYVRRNGVWPCGEDFFHQAAVESYLPLLAVLERLADRGLRDALTIGITPVLANQMEDAHMLRELTLYLGRYELRALRQVANYRGAHAAEFKDLAAFYARHAREQHARLEERPQGITGAFRALEDAGVIELLGGPATHPFLPRLSEPALAASQLDLGLAEHERIFGRRPRGVWLPECGYRPGAGIEGLLESRGLTHFVVDGPTMLRSAGPGSTFRPQRVGESGVAAFARNLDVTYVVWSPTGGYPGDKWYRDFYAYDMEAGFKNWRVTGKRIPIARKRPYEPERGRARAQAHAEDFVALLTRTLDEHARETGTDGLIVACYDTELFGHWWFEGPAFLERVYELLAEHPTVRALSLERALERVPPLGAVALQEGSWGFRKDDRSWVSPETDAMWKVLGDVEAETVRLLAGRPQQPGAARAAAQLLRETFLLQASDWPFMMIRGKNEQYARERFEDHRGRWELLAALLRDGSPDEELERAAGALYDIDNPFPLLHP